VLSLHKLGPPDVKKFLKVAAFSFGTLMPTRGKDLPEILRDDVCVVLLDEIKSKIYLWTGEKANLLDKVKAAYLSRVLNWKLFGGAAEIIQDNNVIQSELSKFKLILSDLPRAYLRGILEPE